MERQEQSILLLGNWTFVDEIKEEEKYSLIIVVNVNLASLMCQAHAKQSLYIV